MAKATPELIAALHRTLTSLRKSKQYQWGHMGGCNCGHLAQEITKLSRKEIHARALRSRSGDWNEQLIDYCPTSGLPMDEVISEMLTAGLDRQDLMHLEKLSDPKILKRLAEGEMPLQHNKKSDVIIYIEAWTTLLEEQWLRQQTLTEETEKKPNKLKIQELTISE